MSEPFISEIRVMSFSFAPKGWALCNGQLLLINQNQALFSLLGTTFGGDGRVNFALPDFRGRTPIHVGSGHTLGERAGEETHTLSLTELPGHNHQVGASSSSSGGSASPVGRVLGGGNNVYHTPDNPVSMNPATIGSAGESGAHPNMQPFQTLSFCIALQGIFPSRN